MWGKYHAGIRPEILGVAGGRDAIAEANRNKEIYRLVANADFENYYNSLTPSGKLEYDCNTGTAQKSYSYYEATCQSRCTGYKLREGYSWFETVATVDQYITIMPDTTIQISSGNIGNLTVDSTITVDLAHVNDIYPSLLLNPSFPFRYWWPQDYYVNLGIPCGESCCKIERSYCWNPSLDSGNGGMEVTETVVYGIQYADCATRDLPSNWCNNWIEDQYGPITDWTKFHSEQTNCEEVCGAP
ncbi:hypothetical protein OAQ99_01620 [Candidatus Kapabacteria bacterium]|nr:hypothetical protein [Candidatus Kapabacteria bacterium]